MQKHVKKTRRTNLLVMMMLIASVTSLLLHARTSSASATSGRVIDLFTQKAPFDGKGANQSSDMFEPQELVVLYALVTYNNNPVASKLVAFEVKGPSNEIENITGSAITNESGIAVFSFRLPWPPENPEERIFGEWFAVATVSVADERIVDALTFKVGWVLRITSVKTLDTEFRLKERYLRQSPIIFDLTIENLARTQRVATITVDVQDSANNPIIHVQLDNLIFQSGESHLNTSSQVPITASVGQAIVVAAAYTLPPIQGGVLYSPAVSTTFEIITRDVAIISVTPSKTIVQNGETIDITVAVRNKGNETESFYITTYYNHLAIDRKLVTNLAPSTEEEIVFRWNTTDAGQGTYTISAVADRVEGEIEVDDNMFVDGTITILPSVSPFTLPNWILFAFMIGVVVIASVFLLFLLCYSRRQRKKRRSKPLHAVIAHPHI